MAVMDQDAADDITRKNAHGDSSPMKVMNMSDNSIRDQTGIAGGDHTHIVNASKGEPGIAVKNKKKRAPSKSS
jgi:hypothetical protein